MTTPTQESPFFPLFKGTTKNGNLKYSGKFKKGDREYWLNLFPNTSKRSEKSPDFHFSIEPAKPREQGHAE